MESATTLQDVHAARRWAHKHGIDGPTPCVWYGLPLCKWTYASCTVWVAVGDEMFNDDGSLRPQRWASIYDARSTQPRHGHASVLLPAVKAYYEAHGRTFGSVLARSPAMHHLLHKFGIHEYPARGTADTDEAWSDEEQEEVGEEQRGHARDHAS